MILVTGCSGFVGIHLVNALTQSGFQVKCLSRGTRSLDHLPEECITFVPGDVTDPESLIKAAEGADTIIHLVGIIREKGDASFERIHVGGTRNIISAAKARGVRRIIYMSALGARESGGTGYETTKWRAERMVQDSGLEWIVVRPSTIIGRWGGFSGVLLDLVRKPPVIPVIGSGEYRLQPLYIGDLCAAFLKMIEGTSLWGRTYEFGGPEQLTFNQMLEITREVLGSRKRMVHLPLWFMRPMIRVMETVLPNPPITSDQLTMLLEESLTGQNAFTEVFGIELIPFREALRMTVY